MGNDRNLIYGRRIPRGLLWLLLGLVLLSFTGCSAVQKKYSSMKSYLGSTMQPVGALFKRDDRPPMVQPSKEVFTMRGFTVYNSRHRKP